MTSYTLSATVPLSYVETLERVRAGLADQGFGILTEIDLAGTLRDKLGAELPPQVILGACRPPLAYAALQTDPSIAAVLPCNVVVRTLDESTTVVEVFDPAVMMRLADNDALDAVAADAGTRLRAMLDAVAMNDSLVGSA